MKYIDIKIALRTMSLRVIVCTTFLVLFYWIGFPNLLFAESENETTENKMLFGFYKEVSGIIDLNVLCNIGIEQWEDNKKSENIVHVWEITLSNDTNTDFYMDLHVERYALLGNDTSIVNSFEVNTINKLLTIDKLDFEEGIFRFRFKFTETSNDVVFVNIRFITENNILYLTKFKALSTVTTALSNELLTIEYKIPEYTSIKNVPVRLNGFKTIEQRKRDEMLSTFSKNDKAVFEELGKYIVSESFMRELEKRIKKIFPDYTLDDIDSGKVQLKDTEMVKILDLWKEIISWYCVKEGMSKEATTQVTTYFEQTFLRN